MNGLLRKDIYTLIKQMKIFLLLIVVFAILPGYSMSAFAIVYAALMPMTALAYDERSKWDQLAAMMPYSVRDLVLSKYILGYLAVFSAFLLSLLSQTLQGLFSDTAEGLAALVSTLCLALTMLAATLPLMFRSGVEKGRLLFLLCVVVVTLVGMQARDLIVPLLDRGTGTGLLIAAALLTLGLQFLSVALSTRFYAVRRCK